ncbi:MAG TPA: glycosyltransferase [Longimicrobium sp.]|nr:glycosyltransferase [Longimicrobium sp.]
MATEDTEDGRRERPSSARFPAPAPRSIALIEPVGDVGIGGYTHELAQALCGHGVRVSVFARPDTFALRLPRAYRLLPVLGLPTEEAEAVLRGPGAPHPDPEPPLPAGAFALEPYFDALERLEARRAAASAAAASRAASTPSAEPAAGDRADAGDGAAGGAAGTSPRAGGRGTAPETHLPAPAEAGTPGAAARAARVRTPDEARERTRALATHLLHGGFDAVWTQWPVLAGHARGFHRLLSAAGMPLAHTVHNVFPHERGAGEVAASEAAYRAARALVVHSQWSAAALDRAFPGTAERTIGSWHGLYTMFPRAAGARRAVRQRLGVGEGRPLLLCFGPVRPYKNGDAVIAALADARCRDAVLAVAGSEWGYAELVLGDRLGRTRRLAARHGVADRVRLLPGAFGLRQAAELFEAADAVVLPYTESYGSGVLLLAMSFGKHVVATAAGGMDEYLAHYAASTLLHGHDPASVADGIARAIPRLGDPPAPRPPRFEWPAITARLLPCLGHLLG